MLGVTYSFRLKSRSAFDFSVDYSNEASVLAADIPDQPVAPTTAVVGSDILFDWVAPSANGSPITQYSIMVESSDPLYYFQDLTSCDGSDSTIVSQTQCSVPITSLLTAPFNLDWGASITAYVIATNSKGNSEESQTGNGALISTNPAAPISLSEVTSLRTASSITISWQQAPFNGGLPVLDYRVSFSVEGSGVYTVS